MAKQKKFFTLNGNLKSDADVLRLLTKYSSLKNPHLGLTTNIKELLREILPSRIQQLESACQEKSQSKLDRDMGKTTEAAA